MDKHMKLKQIFSRENVKFVAIFTGSLAGIIVLLIYLILPFYTRQHQLIAVPNVCNLSYSAAEKILKQKDLKIVKAAEKYDENFPPGFVIFQNPEPGSTVKKGRRIYLTVGKGQRVIEMPKLVGLAERDAKFVLSDHNLRVGQISYEIDEFLPDGVVSEQSIEIGRLVSVGEQVDLTVSLGVEPTIYIVPNLVGKSLQEALREIKKAGLTLGKVNRQKTDKLLPNTVISQSFEAGLEVDRGDTLNLVISQLKHGIEEQSESWSR
ncbi:PASTA domain-containing protein [candidate division KSB1 bacterium]|nr:PASTA domain-containing protein [candidate division KSB1 bacterium]